MECYLWQSHAIEHQMLGKTLAVLIMRKSPKILQIAQIAQSRALHIEFVLTVVSTLEEQ